MSLPSKDQLNELSRAELLGLLSHLLDRVAQLGAEEERLKHSPMTSHNSAQLPSRDQKGNLPQSRRRKRQGAKAGHVKMERALVEGPDQVVVARVRNGFEGGCVPGGHPPTTAGTTSSPPPSD